MAIKRLNPDTVFKIICVFDDALENENEQELKELKEKNEKPRYQIYMDNFDESVLKFKEGASPDRFHVRCLKNKEMAEINQKHQRVDVLNKTIEYKNWHDMMLELFDKAVLGIEDASGKVSPITSEDVGYEVAVEIGSMVSLLSTLNKNLKKQ